MDQVFNGIGTIFHSVDNIPAGVLGFIAVVLLVLWVVLD
jgi:hypothetical protein